MDANGSLFSTLIALGTGACFIALVFGLVLIVAGVVVVGWMLLAAIYWINEGVTALEKRKAENSNPNP